jgi:DNA-binding PadR family transcriptional regulator
MESSKAEKGVRNASEMRSPVYWALLGLVIDRPGLYGYQLVKRFEREYDDVLPLSSNSHIYTALNALRSRGLIEVVAKTGVVESDGERQPKPRYRATSEGSRGYQDWLCAQVGKDLRQARLFARQLAVLARDPTAALGIIGCLEEASLQEARHAKADSVERAHSDEGPGLADELESRERRLLWGAKLEFADYARSRFETLRQREACSGGPVTGA